MFSKHYDLILKVLAFVFSILGLHCIFNCGDVKDALFAGALGFILFYLSKVRGEETEKRRKASVILQELQDSLEENEISNVPDIWEEND